MRIIVLGGSGFIGTRLCQRLKSEFKILDKKSSLLFQNKTIISDIRNFNSLSKAVSGSSVLINLAAEHRDNVRPKKLYYQVNVDGAKNLCRAAVENKINKIIFTSSVAVYGFNNKTIGESGDLNPINDYGKSKFIAEEIYKKWQAEDPAKRSLVIIRPTVVFGEGNRGNFYNLLNQIFLNRFIMLGSGKNKKSIAYVENVAAFIEFSLTSKPGVFIFNYIDKPNLSMSSLVNIVNKLLGRPKKDIFRLPYILGLIFGFFFDFFAFILNRKFTISSIRVKKFCSNSTYNSAVFKTDFVPPVKILEGIRRTMIFEFLKK